MTTFYVKDPDSSKNEYSSFDSIKDARAYASGILRNSYWSSIGIFVGCSKGLLLGTVSKDKGGYKWITSNKTQAMDVEGNLL